MLLSSDGDGAGDGAGDAGARARAGSKKAAKTERLCALSWCFLSLFSLYSRVLSEWNTVTLTLTRLCALQ